MLETKKYYKIYIIAALVVGLIIVGFWDLDISIALHNSQSAFGKFFRVAGDLPMFVFFPMFGSVVFWMQRKREFSNPKKQKFACLISLAFLMLASVVFGYRTLTYITLEGGVRYTCFALISTIIFSLSLMAFAKTKEETLNKWFWLFLVAVFFALVSNALVQTIKIVWGRVRFRNLTSPDYAGYTPWYMPNFFSGNKSFPSGHTTSACGFLIVPWMAKTMNLNRKYISILSAFSLFFVAATALSRIILGAHYATDTLAAITICYLVLNLARKIVPKLNINVEKENILEQSM